MHVNQVEDLPPEPERAVIINVGTELVTTLALASALKHASMPVLLINCDPTPQSSAHFAKLMLDWKFDILLATRRPHGRALDGLFRSIKSESVLLVDSDAEIRDPEFIQTMRQSLEEPAVFGAGFVNGPGWLGESLGCTPKTCLFQERPLMPCVLFRSADVRDALAAGVSFSPRIIYNDFMPSLTISKLLAKRFQNRYVPRSRFLRRLPDRIQERLRRSQFSWLRWARRSFYGLKPNYVYCDTGAEIYQWCKYQREKVFAGLPDALLKDEIKHYFGVTRLKLDPTQAGATLLADVEEEVRDRLWETYEFDWEREAEDLN